MKTNLPAGTIAHPPRPCISAAIIGIALGMTAVPAAAYPAADLTRLSLEELLSVEVYSASKFVQKTTEAPSSVTIITAADIGNYGYRTLGDLLNSVRGMNVAYDRNYAYLGVRGSGRTGDFNSRMLLLVDGYRLNDPIYDTAAIGTDFPLDMDLIDRVEVIRGPGSSIYGSNAILGVINVITKRGSDLDGLEASGELAGFGTDKERLSYGKRYGNGAELLLSASRYRSRGQDLFFPEFDTPADNNGIAANLDGDAYDSVFGKLAYENFTVTLGHSSRDKAVPTASYDTAFNDPNFLVTDSSSFIDLDYSASLNRQWEVAAHAFQGRYAYRGLYPYAGPPVVLNMDTANGAWWGAEVKLVGQFDRHKLVAGAEYQDNFQQEQTNYDIAPYTLHLDDRRSSTREGVYIQDEITLAQPLLLNAGLRYDRYSTVGDTLNPRLGLIWNPLDTTSVKLLYGTAFRAPNAYELYYAVAGSQKANPALKPEKIRTREFVVEHWLRPDFRLTADAYANRISDNINQITDSADDLVFMNTGQVNARGVEFEAERLWSGGARLRASYAWQLSREESGGAELVNSPRNLLKVNGAMPVCDGKLLAGLELQYTGSRKTLGGNVAGGHAVTNLTLSGRGTGNMTLSASLYNLFDKHHADPGGQEHVQDMIEQDGRSFRLKLGYSF
ncbi:MAG: hypothetical protein A2Z95_09195 [Gallionellales bacterium GWA2_60_18]|nr:MAG: hypothetical protein A2Z95_09195 [Gallionellales bacterium GWA2_60_18]